jgi:hypothetical protein
MPFMFQRVARDLEQQPAAKRLFPSAGSVMWYAKAVQLDLEARGLIARVPQTSPLRFRRLK